MENNSTPFSSLFSEPALAALLPSQCHCRGFIFAVATSPEIPMPEQWMPWLVANAPVAASDVSFEHMAEGLMDGLRQNLQAMRNNTSLLPGVCQWHDNAAERKELTAWLSGLLSAHGRLEPVWQRAWQLAVSNPEKDKGVKGSEDPAKRLSRCLKLFSTLANPGLAMERRTDEQAAALQQHLPQLAAQLPAMLKEYVDLAGELAGVLPDQFETFVQMKE